MIHARGAPLPGGFRVQRWTRVSIATGVATIAVIAVLAIVPFLFGADVTEQLTALLIFVILAVMWNALAGYGGLISVGQQAFIGLGAYGTIFLTQHGFTPYLAMVVAGLGAGAVAIPASLIMLRLRGGQFAIGMWVLAEVFGILVTLDTGLGGGTGVSLNGLDVFAPGYRQAYTFWLTLACATVLLGLVFILLRRRIGTSLQAVRDDEEAAASLGVNVVRSKRVLFVVAAVGCGIAGALYLANTLFIQTNSVFGVQWTAYMLFMVLVGGSAPSRAPSSARSSSISSRRNSATAAPGTSSVLGSPQSPLPSFSPTGSGAPSTGGCSCGCSRSATHYESSRGRHLPMRANRQPVHESRNWRTG